MRRLALITAAAVLLLAGCSKSDQTTTTASSTAPATTPATSAPTTTEKDTPATTAKKRATTTTEADGPTTTAEPKNPDSEYCVEAKATTEKFAEGNELNPMEDAAAFSAFIGEAAVSAQNMAAVAPDEIKAEWEAIADAFAQLAAVPPAQLMEELTKMGDDLDTAGEAIDTFTLAECGFDMNGDSGSSSGSSSDDTGATR